VDALKERKEKAARRRPDFVGKKKGDRSPRGATTSCSHFPGKKRKEGGLVQLAGESGKKGKKGVSLASTSWLVEQKRGRRVKGPICFHQKKEKKGNHYRPTGYDDLGTGGQKMCCQGSSRSLSQKKKKKSISELAVNTERDRVAKLSCTYVPI